MNRIQRINKSPYDYTIHFNNVSKVETETFHVEKAFLRDVKWYEIALSSEMNGGLPNEIKHEFNSPCITKLGFRLFLEHLYVYGGRPTNSDIGNTGSVDDHSFIWLISDFVGMKKNFTQLLPPTRFSEKMDRITYEKLAEDFKTHRDGMEGCFVHMLGEDVKFIDESDVRCAVCRQAHVTLSDWVSMYNIAAIFMDDPLMNHARNVISYASNYLMGICKIDYSFYSIISHQTVSLCVCMCFFFLCER